ncbi:hypothetical protein PIB30_033966 [Stylosanthes scabra]|uniref:Uncharacterized protein n=1 Tax=Stylosanthes scabra TaxID=79078 RepID=A0ABU6RCY4_9FABA|nr:hypothetical protein [Stylosanthes scabra]
MCGGHMQGRFEAGWCGGRKRLMMANGVHANGFVNVLILVEYSSKGGHHHVIREREQSREPGDMGTAGGVDDNDTALEGGRDNGNKARSPAVVIVDEEVSNDGLKQDTPSFQKERSFNLLADVAIAFCGDGSVVSEEVLSGRCPRKLEYATFNEEDMNIMYSMKQTYIGLPFAYLNHNRTDFVSCVRRMQYMDLAFRPPAGMPFVGMEMSVAAYVFSKAARFLTRTTTVTGHGYGPMQVLNMVVMCNGSGDGKRMWWFPTTFSQMILDPRKYNQRTMDYIKERYMGKADDITRARYVDSMLKESAFWNDSDAFRPCIEDFEPDYPIGLWSLGVSMDDQLPFVEGLCLEVIISDRSLNYWNAEMLRHFKAQHRGEGKGKSPAKSSNITI